MIDVLSRLGRKSAQLPECSGLLSIDWLWAQLNCRSFLLVLNTGTLVMACLVSTGCDSVRHESRVDFEDVTTEVGIDPDPTSSWGLSWCDFDNNHYSDLWIGRHNRPSKLYRNERGKFVLNFTSEPGDAHGVSCADFDNDGDRDLFEVRGANRGRGTGPNVFLVRSNGTFKESALRYGLDFPYGRGRRPVWMDFDNDGDLDLLILNAYRKDGLGRSSLFRNDKEVFRDVTDQLGVQMRGAHPVGAVLSDMNGDRALDLMVFNTIEKSNPIVLYRTGAKFVDQSQSLRIGRLPRGYGVVVQDFNGDLVSDILLSRASHGGSEVIPVAKDTLYAYMQGTNAPEFAFTARGDVSFDISIGKDGFGIYTGASRNELRQSAPPEKIDRVYDMVRRFTLRSDDTSVQGIPTNRSGQPGFLIGYDRSIATWHVKFASPDWAVATVKLGGEGISTVSRNSAFDTSPGKRPHLQMSSPAGYVDQTRASGLAKPLHCHTAAAGDFDNDMDVDIYWVCTGQIRNEPDLIAWNDGHGKFTLETALPSQVLTGGRGDQAAVADFDRDGFLDVVVTNGEDEAQFSEGPVQLLKNMANGNNWLEIDLVGTISNRDAIGASVLLKTSNRVQLREQRGGINVGPQDDRVLHFGLGRNERVDEIDIRWPSGRTQVLRNIAANQILEVSESEALPDE